MEPSARSVPTGPGSRGGTYHLPGMANAYQRAWRRAHPEYRERESLRLWRRRHPNDPEPQPRRLRPAGTCQCGCGCRVEIVEVCAFCRDGLHDD